MRDALHLFACDGIDAATETHQLHEFGVGARGDGFKRPIESAVESPLIDDVERVALAGQILGDEAHGVFGEHVCAHRFDQSRDAVVNVAVEVIGMTGEHNDKAGRIPDFKRLGFDVMTISFQRGRGFFAGPYNVLVLELRECFTQSARDG